MDDPTVYLAHPGKHKKRGKGLQKRLEKEGYTVINPFDFDENARRLTGLWEEFPKIRTDPNFCEKIVEKDLKAIDRSDIVVAYVTTPSIGTSMEVFYASRSKKSVYILTKIDSPWLKKHGKIVKTVKELLGELKRWSI